MKIVKTPLEGVYVIEPRVFTDDRGYFFETYQSNRYKDFGISYRFVQDNVSFSVRNTLRGLHYQLPNTQAKLVQVLKGEVFDVAVDIRIGSPTFGRWFGTRLSEHNHKQLLIPDGFAHGFCVLSDDALFSYKCSDFYAPEAEKGILWNDTQVGIQWPIEDPILSDKDKGYKPLNLVPGSDLPCL